MKEKNYLEDISHIKDMMNRSSRFISLSGASGIFAGCYAIIGGMYAYFYLFPGFKEQLNYGSTNFYKIIGVALIVLLLSISTAIILTSRKAKKNSAKIWDITTQRLVVNFLIPLVTGGIYIILKLQSEQHGLTAALMLIFYGLALVNASKYTIGNIKYLGLAEIILGLFCATFPGYGFWFWIVGFGIFHIIYGSMMLIEEKKA
ncbi:hypothetical protein [Joostella sp. CR20]|uniref:hypothetical protein n=1 Tax=Joostella sp. CR20 TaxID=2804312 RepID=UPI00313CEDE8